MNEIGLVAGIVMVVVATAVLMWVSMRAHAQAKRLEGISKRLNSSPGPTPPAPTADPTMIERNVTFDHYDPKGGAPIPHLVCLAIQDVVLEAEINGFICTSTPTVVVEHSSRQIHVGLQVARPASDALEEGEK